MAELKFHEFADFFPLLEGKDQENLVKDIKENGQVEPIILYNGEILDGRNRYLACKAIGIEPKTEEYTGSDPLKYVLSKNLHRRHLTVAQRAMIAAEIANRGHGGDRNSEQARNSVLAQVSDTQAAEALKVSSDSVRRARTIKKKATPKIIKEVNEGKMSLNAAAKTTKTTKTNKPAKPAKRTTAKPGGNREDFEVRLASMKEHLSALESMTDLAEQMSEELRYLLIQDLKGIAVRTETIVKKISGNDSLRLN